jgi:hypothetical protein
MGFHSETPSPDTRTLSSKDKSNGGSHVQLHVASRCRMALRKPASSKLRGTGALCSPAVAAASADAPLQRQMGYSHPPHLSDHGRKPQPGIVSEVFAMTLGKCREGASEELGDLPSFKRYSFENTGRVRLNSLAWSNKHTQTTSSPRPNAFCCLADRPFSSRAAQSAVLMFTPSRPDPVARD